MAAALQLLGDNKLLFHLHGEVVQTDRQNGKKLLIGDWTPVAGWLNPPGRTLGHHSVLTATGKLQAVVRAHQHRFIIRAHICAHAILRLVHSLW